MVKTVEKKEEENLDEFEKGFLENNTEIEIVTFEYAIVKLFHSLTRWMEDCQRYVSDDDLGANEVIVLHGIGIGEKAKTLNELGRMLNRIDFSNINYSVKKLIQLKYVEKTNLEIGSKKIVAFRVTEQGSKNIYNYFCARRNILIRIFNQTYEKNNLNFTQTQQVLSAMKTVYDLSSNLALDDQWKISRGKKLL
ncbi:MAG: winged helix DNA-binding protein [Pseudomonadota bacterium]